VRKNSRLPNLHNFGIHLRVLLIVNTLTIIVATLFSQTYADFFSVFTELSAVIQPILIISLVVLYLTYRLLQQLHYAVSVILIIGFVMLLSTLIVSVFRPYFSPEALPSLTRICLFSGMISSIVMYYLNLQQRAYSPAIAEARLQALQARIRPHFLFNSINAVLSLIRSQPKRAETALEDMADLFRVLMADNRELVPLAQEIALSRQYLSIEKLRLEDRLTVTWKIEQMPSDAMIPPLILQPLLENAVYHGIEPLVEGGEIVITVYSQRHELNIMISNPYIAEKQHHQGNKMALKNIKERLLLHFDLEASLTSQIKDKRYEIIIRIPCRH
jgi:two-component system sensor histidine kinase AlgZ